MNSFAADNADAFRASCGCWENSCSIILYSHIHCLCREFCDQFCSSAFLTCTHLYVSILTTAATLIVCMFYWRRLHSFYRFFFIGEDCISTVTFVCVYACSVLLYCSGLFLFFCCGGAPQGLGQILCLLFILLLLTLFLSLPFFYCSTFFLCLSSVI